MFGLRSLARQSFVRFNSTSNTVTTTETLAGFKMKLNNGTQPEKNTFISRNFESKSFRTDDPFIYATQHIIPDTISGRSVRVMESNFGKNINQFNYMVRSNNLKSVHFDQRFYQKPNKKRLAKKVALRKKAFEGGIAKLFNVVKDAVRNGY